MRDESSEGREQGTKILFLVQLSDGQDDREFRAVQPGMIRWFARPACDTPGDDRIIDYLRMAAFQARNLRKFGRHPVGDSHDGVRVGIGTARTAKQTTSTQGLVQCRDRAQGTLCDVRGHCCRRDREDVHGEKRVRSFTVHVCRHACGPSRQPCTHEERQLARPQMHRYPDSRITNPPGKRVGHERSSSGGNSFEVFPRSGVTSLRREIYPRPARYLLGIMDDESLEQKINLVSTLEQAGGDVQRLALGPSSGEARGKDGDAPLRYRANMVNHFGLAVFLLRSSPPVVRTRRRTRMRWR